MKITTVVTFSQDANSVTAIAASGTAITQLDSGDLAYGGDFVCGVGAILPVSTITDQLVSPIESAINGATCKKCDADDRRARTGATCTGGTCTFSNGTCEQELGIDGRMAGSALFGSLSPGTTGGARPLRSRRRLRADERKWRRHLARPPRRHAARRHAARSCAARSSPDVTIRPGGGALDLLRGQHAARRQRNVRRRDRPPQVAARGARVRRLQRRLVLPHDRPQHGRAADDRYDRPVVALARQARRDQLADGARPAPAEPADDRPRHEHVHDRRGTTRTLTDPLLDIKFTGDGDRFLRAGRRPVHPRVHGRLGRPSAGRPRCRCQRQR